MSRRTPRRRIVALTGLAGLVTAGAVAGSSAVAAPPAACPGSAPMTFDKPKVIDTERAGGEPIIATHPDGTLLYGSHAGTTHYFTPRTPDEQTEAFFGKYTGQAYYYWSADHGKTWKFVPRPIPPDGVPNSGFSDPDFAIDKAGNVFISEINLINIAMSKSTYDRKKGAGRDYKLQNFFSQTITDRQWTEADEKDVVYMASNAFGGGTFPTKPAGNLGHYMYKSTDGGKTFSGGFEDGDGLGDIRVDKRDGTVYEAYYDTSGPGLFGPGSPTFQRLSMAAYRDARKQDFKTAVKPSLGTIADGVDMLSHWPAFDLDPQGNLYVTWDESGRGKAQRPAGIYYSYSTDQGRTWAAPTRVDTDNKTNIWPWIAVGDNGRVGIVYFEADKELPKHDAQTQGSHFWRIVAAQSLNGLGCETSAQPGFTTAVATPDPMHQGTICQGGTLCQAQAIDRRLGDYFSVEIDATGALVSAYSYTRDVKNPQEPGGAVALPGFLRQSGGPSFLALQPGGGGGGSGGGSNSSGSSDGRGSGSTNGRSSSRDSSGSLAATGGPAGLAAAALLLVAVGAVARRRSRRSTPDA